MVEATLDLSENSLHTYVIKPEYDEALQDLAKKIRAIRDTLDEEHARVGEDLNLDLDKKLHLENKETVGYVFRVTKTVLSSQVRLIGDRTNHLASRTPKLFKIKENTRN